MKRTIFILPLLATVVFLVAFKNLNSTTPQKKLEVKYGATVTYTAVKNQSSWECQTPKWDMEPTKISVEGRTDCMWPTAETATIVARADAKSRVPSCYKLADPDGTGQVSVTTCPK
jgi:hypothetical protein